MKKIVSFLLNLFLVLCLTACGTYNPASGSGGGGGNSGGGDGAQSSGKEFTVSLVCDGETIIPSDSIKAQWSGIEASGSQSFSTASFEEDGKARVKGLDGEYQVTLSKTPAGYAYNPNIYVASNENKDITIQLYPLNLQPSTQGGVGSNVYKPLEISNLGAYKVSLKNASQKIYYSFNINRQGVYIIQSWCDTTAGVVNPIADVYGGTFANCFLESVCDKGVEQEMGYTTNFSFTAQATSEQSNHVSRTFAVYATERNGNYPVDIVFYIERQTDYNPEVIHPDIKRAQEATEVSPEGNGQWKWIFDENNPKGIFLTSGNVFYNENDGYYHINSIDGPYLYARLNAKTLFIPDYVDQGGASHEVYLANMHNIVPSAPLSNLPELDEITGKKTGKYYDYSQFLMTDYRAVCNSTGDCRVTKELMWCLQAFTVGQAYFYDGNGTAEWWAREKYKKSIYALEADQWLFVCGYYA